MSASGDRRLSAKAHGLREAFDAAFAHPHPPPAPPAGAFLLVRAGGERFALKRDELTGFARSENLALSPGRSPAFVGLAGLRGGLYPVWNLAVFLARVSEGGGETEWLVLTETDRDAPCAFACAAFERMIFTAETTPAAPAVRGARMPFVQAHLAWGTEVVPVLDLRALRQSLLKDRESTQLRNP